LIPVPVLSAAQAGGRTAGAQSLAPPVGVRARPPRFPPIDFGRLCAWAVRGGRHIKREWVRLRPARCDGGVLCAGTCLPLWDGDDVRAVVAGPERANIGVANPSGAPMAW